MTPHETGTPDTPRATAPPARTFGPQGPPTDRILTGRGDMTLVGRVRSTD